MSTPELKELLERVRKAEGPDRSLSESIETEFRRSRLIGRSRYRHATYSLETCLELMKDALPGYDFSIGTLMLAYRANIGMRSANAPVFSADNRSEPLALLDCILQALLNQEARKEKT